MKGLRSIIENEMTPFEWIYCSNEKRTKIDFYHLIHQWLLGIFNGKRTDLNFISHAIQWKHENVELLDQLYWPLLETSSQKQLPIAEDHQSMTFYL